jgi:pyruvate dehydrogenase E1 component
MSRAATPRAATSTQVAFGAVLGGLAVDAPEAAAAVVTVSTVEADRVVSGWMRAAAGDESDSPPGDSARHDSARHASTADAVAVARSANTPELAGQSPGRHVAGALSPGAFGGVLSSLARAWSRLGLALFPVGVADEATAATVLPEWARAAAGDARSLLVVADTTYPAGPGQARWTAPAAGSGAIYWQPAFTQDLVWVTRAALGGLASADGLSHVLRLSARVVDQRLAAVPADPAGRRLRRAQVLAGAYPLRDGGPFGAMTLVGLGAVMPEMLRAADEIEAMLGRRVSVVCVTSPDLLFRAVQARRGLAPGSSAVLDFAFPADRRGPMVAVTDGDPLTLAFLAGVRGDPIATLGSTAPDPSGGDGAGHQGHARGSAGPPAPVHLATVVGAALDLLDD